MKVSLVSRGALIRVWVKFQAEQAWSKLVTNLKGEIQVL